MERVAPVTMHSAQVTAEPATTRATVEVQCWWLLIIAGVASLALYGVMYLRLFPIRSFDPTLPRTAEPFVDHLGAHVPWTWVGHALGMVLVFALYGVAWQVSSRADSARMRWTIVGFAAAFCALFVLVRPEMTVDIIDYAFRSRMIVDYNVSPLTNTPDDLPGQDAWLALLHWREIPTPYGPLWLAIALAPYKLFPGALVANVVALKAISAAAVLGCLAVIWRAATPGAASTALVLFGWNPLVLIELVANGHNDSVMVLFVMVGLWMSLRQRWLVALPALAAAVLIKATAALFIPFVLVHILRLAVQTRSWSLLARAGAGAAAAGGLVIVSYALFWAGPTTLQHISRAQLGSVINSPTAALLVLSKVTGLPVEARVIGIIVGMSAVFVALYLMCLLALWRGQRTLLSASFDGIAAFLVVGASWFWPWYVSWLLGPAALLPDRRRQVFALCLSVGGLAYYFIKALGLTGAGFSLATLAFFILPFVVVAGLTGMGRWTTRAASGVSLGVPAPGGSGQWVR